MKRRIRRQSLQRQVDALEWHINYLHHHIEKIDAYLRQQYDAAAGQSESMTVDGLLRRMGGGKHVN